jgi:hypothetical protein
MIWLGPPRKNPEISLWENKMMLRKMIVAMLAVTAVGLASMGPSVARGGGGGGHGGGGGFHGGGGGFHGGGASTAAAFTAEEASAEAIFSAAVWASALCRLAMITIRSAMTMMKTS